ncbi:HNH endonuclease [Kitasatospora purpeofusca]|uniref:HNH endonuclease n=1 Tax=Kitasatospora purpeofusca TaxID=67352 RepID=UPI003677DB62
MKPEVRAAVYVRADGVCEECQEQLGEEIDHINGDSPELTNLMLLCKGCHRSKTDLRMRPATPEELAVMRELWDTRIAPDDPARLCDSDDWTKRELDLRMDRRERLGGPLKNRCKEVVSTKPVVLFSGKQVVRIKLCDRALRRGACPAAERHIPQGNTSAG